MCEYVCVRACPCVFLHTCHPKDTDRSNLSCLDHGDLTILISQLRITFFPLSVKSHLLMRWWFACLRLQRFELLPAMLLSYLSGLTDCQLHSAVFLAMMRLCGPELKVPAIAPLPSVPLDFGHFCYLWMALFSMFLFPIPWGSLLSPHPISPTRTPSLKPSGIVASNQNSARAHKLHIHLMCTS